MFDERGFRVDSADAIRRFCSRLFRTRWDAVYVGLLVVCGLLVYSQGLERPLSINDEALYMLAAQFSLKNGYWIIPYIPFESVGAASELRVKPFLLKTPLVIWLQMLSMKVFGVSATAARLPAVIFTILTSVLTYYIGRVIYSRTAGYVAGIVTLSTWMIFFMTHGGRSGTMDVPLLFFGTLLVFLLFLSVRRNYPTTVLLPVAGLVLGVAILAKGFNAGLFVLVALPLLIAHRQAFVTREGVVAAGLAGAIPLLWFIAAGTVSGSVLSDMLSEQVVNRVSGSMETTPAALGFMKFPYFEAAPSIFDPWWYLEVSALITVPLGAYRRYGRSRLSTETLFLAWWALSVFCFFLLTGNHSWYLMPMTVPLGLLCGRLLDCGFRPSFEAGGLVVGLVLVLMNSSITGLGIRFVTRGLVAPSTAARAMIAVGLLGVFLAAVYHEQWFSPAQLQLDYTRTKRTVKRVFIVSLIVIVVFQIPLADRGGGETLDQRQLGQQFHAATPPDMPLYIQRNAQRDIEAFVFYTQQPVRGATFDRINSDKRIQYTLIRQSERTQLQRPHERLGTMTVHNSELVLYRFTDNSQGG